MIAFNLTPRTNVASGSPYVRMSADGGHSLSASALRPAGLWGVSTRHGHRLAFYALHLEQGGKFMEVVNWMVGAGETINVLPHTISRYIRRS